MTDVATTTGTGTLAVPDSDVVDGLEDIEESDLVLPFMRINHKEAKFLDGLTKVEHDSIQPIILGLIKQRILWDDDVTDAKPMCRSYQFTEGHPGEDFPWKSSGFEPSDVSDGTLPCETCKLKDWGSHPKRDTPWCSEQYTFALLMPVGTAESGGWAPSLLTLQRSSIKPCKAYLTSFARAKQPLYTVQTTLTLDARSRGSVDYAVPNFIRGPETDPERWPFFSETLRSIREFVQTPRFLGAVDPESDGGVTVTKETPVADPKPAAAAPAPAAEAPAAPATPPDAAPAPEAKAAPATPPDDDLPF